MKQLVAAATAATNPAPNTLSPVSPYATSTDNRFTAQPTWTALSKPAIVPRYNDNADSQKGRLDFNPSNGAAVTYTITVWVLDRVTGTWYTPQDNASATFTGPISAWLYNLGVDPWFIQVSNVSAGTVRIMYDGNAFLAL